MDPSVQSTVLVLRPPIKEDFTTRAKEVIVRFVEIAIPCESGMIWCTSRTTSMLKEQTAVLVEVDLEAPPSARSSSHHHRSAAGRRPEHVYYNLLVQFDVADRCSIVYPLP
jgi:hypothetical protein